MFKVGFYLLVTLMTLSAQAREFLSSTYVIREVEATKNCGTQKAIDILDRDSRVLLSMCERQYYGCSTEGSCSVKDGDQIRLIAFSHTDKETNTSRWVELNPKRCQYGLAVKNICLDPYYSAAADLKSYKLGDVIFVPSLKGMKLPFDQVHSGYLIIRDNSSPLNGVGPDRFHIFTGLKSHGFDNNLLESFDLKGNTKSFAYKKVDEATAQKVRALRNFPLLPGVNASERVEK